jgi:hypothetical protein
MGCFAAVLITAGCGGASVDLGHDLGSDDGGSDAGATGDVSVKGDATSGADGSNGGDGSSHADGSSGADGSNGGDGAAGDDGSNGGCMGHAPVCFGYDITMCCAKDPGGFATCDNGAWMCGSDPAPGCDGTSCVSPGDGGGCTGMPPLCFGSDSTMCCGQDPAGVAECHGNTWMCGMSPAPGCNGMSCIPNGDGG